MTVVNDALLGGAVDRPAVQEGATAADRGEELIASRVEHHAEDGLTVDDEADTDREEGDAVGVVDGAVERVDDPEAVGRATRIRPIPQPGRRRPGRPAPIISRMASSLR